MWGRVIGIANGFLVHLLSCAYAFLKAEHRPRVLGIIIGAGKPNHMREIMLCVVRPIGAQRLLGRAACGCFGIRTRRPIGVQTTAFPVIASEVHSHQLDQGVPIAPSVGRRFHFARVREAPLQPFFEGADSSRRRGARSSGQLGLVLAKTVGRAENVVEGEVHPKPATARDARPRGNILSKGRAAKMMMIIPLR